jgi:hypothetical protein
MSQESSDNTVYVIAIIGLILGTIIINSLWTIEEVANAPNTGSIVGSMLFIYLFCFAIVGAIYKSLNGK